MIDACPWYPLVECFLELVVTAILCLLLVCSERGNSMFQNYVKGIFMIAYYIFCLYQNKETYFNSACSEKYTCQNDQLTCDLNYECSHNAVWKVQENAIAIDVTERTVKHVFRCTRIVMMPLKLVRNKNGVYTIFPYTDGLSLLSIFIAIWLP